MPSLTLRSKSWFDDQEVDYPIPEGWTVHRLDPMDASEMSDESLIAALQNTYGSPPLGELARKKKEALIVVDDLSRPTPTFRVIGPVIEFLTRAGIPSSRISFLIAPGSHRPLTREEMGRKLGRDVVQHFPVANHDPFGPELCERRAFPSGVPVIVNRRIVEADLVLGISCVIPHPTTGFSGGGKLIVPGAAGILTIAYLHSFERKRPRGAIERLGPEPDIRDAIEACAQKAGLDFSINVVVNTKRELAGLFSGCLIQAQRKAAAFARDVYRTEVPADVRDETNVLLLNAYPLDSDAHQESKSLWPRKIFPNASIIMLNAASDGISYHGWGDFRKLSLCNLLWGSLGRLSHQKKVPSPFRRAISSSTMRTLGLRYLRGELNRFATDYKEFAARQQAFSRNSLAKRVTAKRFPLWICSEGYPEEKRAHNFPKSILYPDWNLLCQSTLFRQRDVNITVFPCAPLQIPVEMA